MVMNLNLVIGILMIIGLYTGVKTAQISNKKLGMIQLILTITLLIIIKLYCLKNQFLYSVDLIGSFLYKH